MMLLICEGFSAHYELESLARMLFGPLSRGGGPPPESGDYILAQMRQKGGDTLLLVGLRLFGAQVELNETAPEGLPEKERLLRLAMLLYRCAVRLTGRAPRWGVLTGIRPVKLYRALLSQGMDDAQVTQAMRERYAVCPEMSALALDIAHTQQAILEKGHPRGFGLYVSIPFCPGRCSYCSFVSHSVEQMHHLMPQYVAQLCRELDEIAAMTRALDLKLQTVYFGGGTPTALSAGQLAQLFLQIGRSFDLSGVLEYTVEAGRPDTIDAQKLAVIRQGGAGRICINPQSMKDETLRAIGRRHTAREVEEAFSLARSMGFELINMDLIAGLPGESPEDFADSLARVLALSPENVTVHTLTLKRASDLAQGEQAPALRARADAAAGMVDAARRTLGAAGYRPYYLYRQKNSVGALDNTGYSMPGREGIYNVFIMEEIHTIMAAGAGAVTKLREPGTERIERIFNFKFPGEYLARYHELAARRERVRQFYENSRQV
jgi:oxygen-independent coproporphyrinogen-3 oxidase